MLYKGDKGVKVAVRQPEGSPADARGLSAWNLPLISIPHPARMPDDPGKYIYIYIYIYIYRERERERVFFSSGVLCSYTVVHIYT